MSEFSAIGVYDRELAFQAQLANYGHALRQEGGSIIDNWQPGAPPEWS